MNIVVAGGGTAGHIEPAMNLADEMCRRHPGARVVALGTERGLEVTLVPERGYELRLIPAVPLPRAINLQLATLPKRLQTAICSTRQILREVNADVLVGFGGYVSIPAYFAARGNVPIVIHEANARPGLANRVGARFADAVAETVPGTLPRAVLTGVPLRHAIETLNRDELRTQARDHFDIRDDQRVLLVFGGSQGARRINHTIADCVNQGVFGDVVVIHGYGSKNEPPAPASDCYRPFPYLDRMDLAYAAADFVVCRSGAMTVGEVTAVGLPACFVPFPIGNGEQSLNAQPVVSAGGAIMVADESFTVDFVRTQVMPLLNNDSECARMRIQSKSIGRPYATALLADLVEQVMRK